MNVFKLYCIIFFFILNGCSSQINSKVLDGLSYSVFNYSTDDFANIKVNDKGIANVTAAKFIGSYESSGEYCCISVDLAKKILVNYDLIGEGRKPIHKEKQAVFLNSNNEGSNAILHILPNENFIIEFTNELPEPSEKILDDFILENKLKRNNLDDPSSWRLKNE
ncbi:hypothetical protein [Acinetobacter sp. YH12097]|uniref:hypothetical protein n=1 Tax=Acinetobacter sp. YH12097 TaxID=2601086 RepID=UPI0015D25115|nr:hypothetical protein [Acinetobacter sp. YH12097]